MPQSENPQVARVKAGPARAYEIRTANVDFGARQGDGRAPKATIASHQALRGVRLDSPR